MKSLVKKIFWMMSLSGAVLVFQAFVKPNGLQKSIDLAKKSLENACSDCHLKIYEEEKRNNLRILTPVSDKQKQNQNQFQSQSQIQYPNRNNPNQKEATGKVGVTNQKFIYQNGRYYKAESNNVYYDSKGNPTLVIDNSQARYLKPESPDEENSSNEKTPQPQTGLSAAAEAYSPQGVKDMVVNIQNAKKNMANRNQILNQLARDEQKKNETKGMH